MAYARCNADSDIYLFRRVGDGFWDLTICSDLDGNGVPKYETHYTLEAVKMRLEELRETGTRIPQHAFDRIEEEMNFISQYICPWCGRKARTDAFDTPDGTVNGFAWCAHCDTHEITADLADEEVLAKLYPDEIETGWYRPSGLADTPLRFTRIRERFKSDDENEIPF
jgi:hypothetical protein